MKVALCLFGQPRFFEEGSVGIKHFIDGCDVDTFIHVWLSNDMIGKLYGSVNYPNMPGWLVESDTDKKIIDLYRPKACTFQPPIDFGDNYRFDFNDANSKPAKHIVSQFYSRKAVGQLLKEYSDRSGNTYDAVIFSRTDLRIHSRLIDETQVVKNEVLTAFVNGHIWNNDHLNDPIIISDYDTMIHFSNLYDSFESYVKNGMYLCSHRLSIHHLKQHNVTFKQILQDKWDYIR